MAWEQIRATYTDRKIVKTIEQRVKYNGVFNLQALYDVMHDWLVEEEWGSPKNNKFGETMFKKFERPNNMKDFRIHWRLKKQVNPYIQHIMDIDFNILFITDVETIYKGKKIKTNKSDCDINLRIRTEYDYGGKWSQHPLLKHIAILFPKRIYWKELEENRIRAYRDSYRFQQAIKDFWGLKSWAEEPEKGSYDRPMGLPGYEKQSE